MVLEDNLFFNNRAKNQLATSVMLSDRSFAEVRKCFWEYNHAGTAAAISITRNSESKIKNSRFYRNIADQQVGVILLEQNCIGHIENSIFEQNAAM